MIRKYYPDPLEASCHYKDLRSYAGTLAQYIAGWYPRSSVRGEVVCFQRQHSLATCLYQGLQLRPGHQCRNIALLEIGSFRVCITMDRTSVFGRQYADEISRGDFAKSAGAI